MKDFLDQQYWDPKDILNTDCIKYYEYVPKPYKVSFSATSPMSATWKTPSVDKSSTVVCRAKSSMWKLPHLQLLGWGTGFGVERQRRKVGWGCFKGHISLKTHLSEGNEVLMIYINWKCDILLTCYSKCIYIPNHNAFNQQLTSIVVKYFPYDHSYSLPGKSLSYKKQSIQNKAHSEQFCLCLLLWKPEQLPNLQLSV